MRARIRRDKNFLAYGANVTHSHYSGREWKKINNVTIYHGPQVEALSPYDLPDNMEQLARYERDQLGVSIISWVTFNVIDGLATTVADVSNIEDFIAPVSLPQAVSAILGADNILYS